MAPQEIATLSRQPDLLTFNDMALLKLLHHAMPLEFAEVTSLSRAVNVTERDYKRGIKNKYEIYFPQKWSAPRRSFLCSSF
jgi:hypothetical protein